MKRNEDAVDTGIEAFMSPYLIGEWDFVLTKTPMNESGRHFDKQFRGVTVYGLTDDWTGDDANRQSGSNMIDREVQYQLKEIFNPWDLYAAVEKDTERWVDFHTVTTAEKEAAVGGTNLNITLTNWPVKYASTWDEYCSFGEDVEWSNAMKHPARSAWVATSGALSASEPYELYVNSTSGVGTITIRAASVPTAGGIIKILYSTETEYTYDDYFDFVIGPVNVTRGTSQTVGYSNTTSWIDKLGVNHTLILDDFDFTFRNVTALTTNSTWTYGTYTEHWRTDPFKVFKDETTELRWENSNHEKLNVTQSSNTLELGFDDLDILWDIKGPTHTDVHLTSLHPDVAYNYSVTYNNATNNYTYTGYLRLGYSGELYTEKIPGQYEWVVVGNHSRAIDSVGAAMVSAAFKNKQVEIGNGGLDMRDMWGTNIPYLLDNMGNATWRAGGPSWTNIYDSIGRLGYIDDWCTTYPVSTSNIITVAGPSANLFSEYFNEFSQAIQIYGITSGNLIDVIFATTCWNTTKVSNYTGQYYYSNGYSARGATNTGIGVITTYKDINGTVGFMIHGWSGDDTYYTAKWFHEYGIYYLQTENRGVTTLVVRLDYNNAGERTTNPMPPNYDYTAHNPAVTIIERLGTVSEKMQHDP